MFDFLCGDPLAGPLQAGDAPHASGSDEGCDEQDGAKRQAQAQADGKIAEFHGGVWRRKVSGGKKVGVADGL
ncbi:hypothetical protein D3C72_2098400 [compost metagenome]